MLESGEPSGSRPTKQQLETVEYFEALLSSVLLPLQAGGRKGQGRAAGRDGSEQRTRRKHTHWHATSPLQNGQPLTAQASPVTMSLSLREGPGIRMFVKNPGDSDAGGSRATF